MFVADADAIAKVVQGILKLRAPPSKTVSLTSIGAGSIDLGSIETMCRRGKLIPPGVNIMKRDITIATIVEQANSKPLNPPAATTPAAAVAAAAVSVSDADPSAIAKIVQDTLKLTAPPSLTATLEALGADSIDLGTIETLCRRDKLIAPGVNIKKGLSISGLAAKANGSTPGAAPSPTKDFKSHAAMERKPMTPTKDTPIPSGASTDVALVFDGVGPEPQDTLNNLVAYCGVNAFGGKLLGCLKSCLKDLQQTNPHGLPYLDAEDPSTWDGSTPAIWLSVSLIGHMCIMQRLFADGRIPYGSALGKCVKVVTGHSAGFLSAAIIGCGVESQAQLEENATAAIRFWTKFGAAMLKAYTPPPQSFVPYNVVVVGTPVTHVEAALAKRKGVAMACINAPDQCIVSGETAAVHGLKMDFQDDAIVCMSPPIPYPVHNEMVDHLSMDFEDDHDLIKLFRMAGGTKTATTLLQPESATAITTCKNPKYICVEVVSTVAIAKIDWPATLNAVNFFGPKEVIHIGSAVISNWYEGWGAGVTQTEAKITPQGTLSVAPPPPPKRKR